GPFGPAGHPYMITYLKKGIAEEQSRAADRNVRDTVERMLADIEARGDKAIREYSEKFDRWSPPSFRLTQKDIAALIAKVAPQALADIRFAQAQVRGLDRKSTRLNSSHVEIS